MKRFLIISIAALLLAGCRTSYDITLTNGNKIENVSKPVLDNTQGRYVFKLQDGREMKVSAGRVQLIEPHGESSEPQFVSPTKKKK